MDDNDNDNYITRYFWNGPRKKERVNLDVDVDAHGRGEDGTDEEWKDYSFFCDGINNQV